jgi:hypothetical protein
MKVPSIFPNSIWNGESSSRDSILISRNPDNYDWDQVVAEIIALENNVINNGTRIIRSFVLGNVNPVTVGTDKLDIIFVPGRRNATLDLIRIGAKIFPASSDLIIQINVNSIDVGQYNLAVGDATVFHDLSNNPLSYTFTSGDIISVDVIQADGNVQFVTVDMEFLTR